MLHKPTQRFLPFRTPDRKDTQELAELRIESLVLPKRVESALKLIGDLYLARVHNAATARFYLPDWEAATSRKLDIVANFYQLLTDRVRTAQSQTLELIIIALILAEILMAVFRRVIVNRRVTSAFGGTGGWTSRVTCLGRPPASPVCDFPWWKRCAAFSRRYEYGQRGLPACCSSATALQGWPDDDATAGDVSVRLLPRIENLQNSDRE